MLLQRVYVIGLFMCLVLAPTSACEPESNDPAALRFGVPPWTSSSTADFWSTQIGSHLQKELCQPIRFFSNSNYREFVQSILNGGYELVQVPPHIAMFLYNQHGFVVLTRDRHRDPHIAYFTRADTPLQSLDDLAGQTLATPDELGYVSLFVRHRWRDARYPPIFVTIDKHDKVIEAVLKKQVRAGAVFSPMLASYLERRNIRIQEIASEATIADGFLLASPSMPVLKQQQVTAALLSFRSTNAALIQEFSTIDESELSKLNQQLQLYTDLFMQQFYEQHVEHE